MSQVLFSKLVNSISQTPAFPQSTEIFVSFLDSNDFEDAIRNAIALGGDSDTIAAITGGIAAAYYGIPEDMCNKALNYLDEYLIDIHDKFYKQYQE